jgi:hypothetical protein
MGAFLRPRRRGDSLNVPFSGTQKGTFLLETQYPCGFPEGSLKRTIETTWRQEQAFTCSSDLFWSDL